MDEHLQRKLQGNLRRFMLFRLLYTACFYYPVFTILFLDYGLSLEQFAILNSVWAVSIAVAEVPSGAMADIVGKKALLIFAAGLMVVEMALIVFAPIGTSSLLFWMFLGNRVCSGLSEAAASGADEALAYDSLKALGREDEWAALLERTTFVVSIGFFTTMILGAFAYDPNLVNRVLGVFNNAWVLPDSIVIRLPVLLTLVTACAVFVVTLGLYDLDAQERRAQQRRQRGGLESLLAPFRQISSAARWTFGHRFVLFVILAAQALDSVGRQFAVLSSEYYRIIDIPVSWFGFVGAGMSLIGILNARFSRYLVSNHSPLFNFLVLSLILMLGLVGISFAIPRYGVIFAVGAFAMMGMVQFQASYYLNREADSRIRATVLSFKGLALNLGLGFASLLYTALVAALREAERGIVPEAELQALVFVESMAAFPVYYLFLFAVILLAARLSIRHCDVFLQPPSSKPGRGQTPPTGGD